MRIVIAAVGKVRHRALAPAIREYESRAARYWPLEFVEVREEPVRSAAPQVIREREGARLLDRLAGMRVVTCEEGGVRMDSEAFARWLRRERESARDLAFVIGGPFGLSAAVRHTAAQRIALAPWTLPHELARLVLAEQLYRAGTILRGEPYHK